MSRTLVSTQEKKHELRKSLKAHFNISPKTRAIVVSRIKDPVIHTFLSDASEALDFTLLSSDVPDEMIGGADACLLQGNESTLFLENLLPFWVVPILPKKSDLSHIFDDFNPMKFTGNAFIYKKNNPFLIFEKLCAFLENMRYPWDKKILKKNIRQTVL